MFFFVFCITRQGKKMLPTSSVNQSLQSLLRNNSHTCLLSLCIQSYISFLLVLNSLNPYPFSSPQTCQYHKIFVKKSCKWPQHSNFSVLQDEEAHNVWFSKFDFRLRKLFSVKLIIDMPQSLEQFIVDRCMCLFIIRIFCDWMATAINQLTIIRTVRYQYHSFCTNTGVGSLVCLTTSNDSRLHKNGNLFYRSALNETIIFCA